MERIEVLHFAGDLAIECSRIKRGNAADAALRREQILPDLFGPDAASAHKTNTRDHDSAVQKKCLSCGD